MEQQINRMYTKYFCLEKLESKREVKTPQQRVCTIPFGFYYVKSHIEVLWAENSDSRKCKGYIFCCN